MIKYSLIGTREKEIEEFFKDKIVTEKIKLPKMKKINKKDKIIIDSINPNIL